MASRNPIVPEPSPRPYRLPDFPFPDPYDGVPEAVPVSAPIDRGPGNARARRAARPAPERRSAEWPLAAIVTIPHVTTVLLALVATVVGSRLDRFSPGAAILFVAGGQAVGWSIARLTGLGAWSRIWLVDLVVTLVLVPLLAVQASVARTPYLAIADGTIWPTFLITLAGIGALVGIGLLCATVAWDAPEEASLLFLPAALVTPVLLGAAAVGQPADGLRGLIEAATIAALAVGCGWLLPRGLRTLVGPLAMGVQLVILWITGRGPTIAATADGEVARFGAALLTVAIVLVVLTPALSFWLRRVVVATALAQEGRLAGGR